MEVINPANQMDIISLKNMVDLALGTPEVGAINFNILHSLLHAILSKLEMDESVASIPMVKTETKDVNSKSTIIPVSVTPYHGLQERIKILENQISALNSLPSNKDIISSILDSTEKPQSDGLNGQKLVSDLWNTINLRKKVNANEEGIDKVSSLVDSILDEMKRLKSDNDNMKRHLEDLSGLKGISDNVDGLQTDLANLLAEFNKMKDQLSQYPSPDSFKNIVTWEGLEKALKGIKDEMEELKKPTERVVVNMATEPMSRPVSSMSSGPSEVCADMLEKLGNLTVAHDLLDKRVVVLEEEMPNKADKKDLESLQIPEDFLNTINQLKAQLDSLQSSKSRDSEALSRIRDILNSLQDKMKEVNETVEKLSNENRDLLTQIEELFGITKDHEHRKVDMGYVDGLMKTKADKSLVDSKVNSSLFEETTGNLHNLIDDVLKKLLAAEEELRNLFKSLASDINGKVDKDDLNALKEWIEKRLRTLAEKLKNMRGADYLEDDAAGLRKQLLQHFHCISCDRPVDILAHGVTYSNGLPEPKGLPPTKSLRPYTTFELDAIRQHSKNNKNIYVPNHTKRIQEIRVVNPKYVSYGNDIIDVYQTPRPCGGSHTTTYPQKKILRHGNMNNFFVDEDVQSRSLKEELDLHGADGHIYKGRFDRSQTTMINNSNYNEQLGNDKLPPVTTTQRSQTIVNSCYTPRGAFVASATRPKSSVRLTPRPISSAGQSRPSSARVAQPEPDSRTGSPILNLEQSLDQHTVEQDEFMSVTMQNQMSNLETVNSSENFNLEVINQSENEIQSTDEALLI